MIYIYLIAPVSYVYQNLIVILHKSLDHCQIYSYHSCGNKMTQPAYSIHEFSVPVLKTIIPAIMVLHVITINTHCYRNPPHDLWARSGISFFRSPVLRVPYTEISQMTTTTLRRPKCSIINRIIFIFPCPLHAIAFKHCLHSFVIGSVTTASGIMTIGTGKFALTKGGNRIFCACPPPCPGKNDSSLRFLYESCDLMK